MEKSKIATAPSARRPLDGTGVRRIPGRKQKQKPTTINIGTWNVRSLLRPEKIPNLIKEIKRLKIDVMGLSDVRWKGNGKHIIDEDHVLYYSGSDESSNMYGVGVVVNVRAVKGNIDFIAKSNRTAMLHIETKPRNFNIVLVYAPTGDKPDQEVNDLYGEVEQLLDATKRHEINIVMGDMNAKVGKGEVQGVVGKYGLGERNDRGDTLVQFCQENDLVIANTFFQLPARRLYTWTSPRHTREHIVRNQIDYLMINSRFRNCIKSVKAYPGADINSDHNPVIAKLSCALKHINKKSTKPRIDIRKMRDIDIRLGVLDEINEWAANAKEEASESVEEQWHQLKTEIIRVSREHLKPSKWEPKQVWMTDEIYQLMEERRLYKATDSTKYEELNKSLRRLVRHTMDTWYQCKCEYVEELLKKHDAFNMHKEIKSMIGRKSVTYHLVDENNLPILDLTTKKAVWEDYIKTMFADESRSTTQTTFTNEGPTILREEVWKALCKAKTGKSAGPDDVYIEILKLIDESNVDTLVKLFNRVYDTGELPEDWLKSAFITLPKKKNAKKCEEFRTISLMSQVLKLFLNIIHERIRLKCDEQLGDSQFGFRSGVGTREALFAVQVVVQKCKDMQQDVFLCFIDYEKAFDRVLHDRLVSLLNDVGLDGKDIRIIRNLYWSQKATVRVDGEETSEVDIMRGVRQGCILSPTLFNLYSETIIAEALEGLQGGVQVNGRYINNLRYADDTVLIASTATELQQIVDRVNECSLRAGLRMNVSKTKVMVVSKIPSANPGITVEGKQLERVRKYKYLGTWLNDVWESDLEIKTRIEIARSAFNSMRKVLCSRRLKMSLRVRLLQCYIWPILLYGCEAWTIKEHLKRRIEAFEMWAYRRMLAISWTQRVTNEEVLRRAGQKRHIMRTIKQRKVGYLGHIMRHERYELLQLIMMGKVAGRRPVGRRRKSWLRNIREWTGITSAAELFRLAKDRLKFQKLTANLQ